MFYVNNSTLSFSIGTGGLGASSWNGNDWTVGPTDGGNTVLNYNQYTITAFGGFAGGNAASDFHGSGGLPGSGPSSDTISTMVFTAIPGSDGIDGGFGSFGGIGGGNGGNGGFGTLNSGDTPLPGLNGQNGAIYFEFM